MTVEQGIEEPERTADGEEEVGPRPPPLPGRARLMRGIVVAALLALGVGGAIFAVADRQTDDPLVLELTHPRSVAPLAVERAVGTAPDPVAIANGRKTPQTVRVDCTAGGPGALRNPWSCTGHYSNGDAVRYQVTIKPDGSWVGRHRPPISGCCIAIPRSVG